VHAPSGLKDRKMHNLFPFDASATAICMASRYASSRSHTNDMDWPVEGGSNRFVFVETVLLQPQSFNTEKQIG
ncbi:hypothetical protein AB4144_34290, partial [Rhizobiaceae sp. 2RAB30]